jgi:hypothetical protein
MIITNENLIDKEGYWMCELMSLGIQLRRKNELDDARELEALTNNLKDVNHQSYKIAYGAVTS